MLDVVNGSAPTSTITKIEFFFLN